MHNPFMYMTASLLKKKKNAGVSKMPRDHIKIAKLHKNSQHFLRVFSILHALHVLT